MDWLGLAKSICVDPYREVKQVEVPMTWYICKCGHETENADMTTQCPDCLRVGCWCESEDQDE